MIHGDAEETWTEFSGKENESFEVSSAMQRIVRSEKEFYRAFPKAEQVRQWQKIRKLPIGESVQFNYSQISIVCKSEGGGAWSPSDLLLTASGVVSRFVSPSKVWRDIFFKEHEGFLVAGGATFSQGDCRAELSQLKTLDR